MVAAVNSESWRKSISSLLIPSTLKFLVNSHNGSVASGLHDVSVSKQKLNTLLYSLGEKAEFMLKSTNITEEETKNYETVLEKFDSFFQVRRSVIFERARFNRWCQLPGESVEQYIVELYNLVEPCNYRDLIRDHVIISILDKTLSERLQLDPALTLGKVKQMIHQCEAVQEQQQVLKRA